MATPISQDVGISASSHMFLSLDEKLCRSICEGSSETLEFYLNKGLSPDYKIEKDVIINNSVFTKGSSLIFIVIHCCLHASFPWDFLAMAELLLEREVDLEMPFTHGGGQTNVLEYACANEPVLLQDLILLLLKAASPAAARRALNKIPDPTAKQHLSAQLPLLSPKSASSSVVPEPQPSTSAASVSYLSSQLPFSLNEEEIFQALQETTGNSLRKLFDRGLNPCYTFNKECSIGSFSCKSGETLFLTLLRACVENKSVTQFENTLIILIEKGANLTKECSGTNPLLYLCENACFFSSDIIICVLTSASSKLALKALEQVPDPERKDYLKAKLSSTTHPFSFEKSSIDSSQLKQLVLELQNKDFSRLNSILFLSNTQLLKEYNLATQELDPSFTLCSFLIRSFLIHSIKDIEILYDIVLCFFKNNFSASTKIYEGKNLVEFLCYYRLSLSFSSHASFFNFIKLLCLSILFLNTPLTLQKLTSIIALQKDATLMKILFVDNNTTGLLSPAPFLNFPYNHRFFPLVEACITASIIKNKNVVTQTDWDVNYIFSLLHKIIESLHKKSLFTKTRTEKINSYIFAMFKFLLKTASDIYTPRQRVLYVSWFESQSWTFLHLGMEDTVTEILLQFWGSILYVKTDTSLQPSTSSSHPLLKILDSFYFYKYFLNTITITVKESEVHKQTLDVLQNFLANNVLAKNNPATGQPWNTTDLECLLSALIQRVSCYQLKTPEFIRNSEILTKIFQALMQIGTQANFSIQTHTFMYEFLQQKIIQFIDKNLELQKNFLRAFQEPSEQTTQASTSKDEETQESESKKRKRESLRDL